MGTYRLTIVIAVSCLRAREKRGREEIWKSRKDKKETPEIKVKEKEMSAAIFYLIFQASLSFLYLFLTLIRSEDERSEEGRGEERRKEEEDGDGGIWTEGH